MPIGCDGAEKKFALSRRAENVDSDDVLRWRLSAGRRAAARGRSGGETDIRTPIPASVAVAVVVFRDRLVHPPTVLHAQTARQPVAAGQGVRRLTPSESALVFGDQQPEVGGHPGPGTDRIHARRGQR